MKRILIYCLYFSLTVLGNTAICWGQVQADRPIYRVAVLDIIGSSAPQQDLEDLQLALNRAGLQALDYQKLLTVIDRLEISPTETARANTRRQIAEQLRVDFLVIVDYPSRTKLVLDIIDGQTGQPYSTQSFRVSALGLTSAQWRALGIRIRKQLPEPTALLELESADTRMVGINDEDDAVLVLDEEKAADFGATESAPGDSVVKLQVGSLAINRNFAASGRQQIDNPLTGGIEYRLGFVPGFAIDAEFIPFRTGRSIGFGAGYERAFFRTKQTTIVPVASANGGASTASTVRLLESGHSLMYGRIFYEHRLPSLITLSGGLKGSIFQFTVDGDSEYRGVTYTALELELGGQFPLYANWLYFELRGNVSPIVSLGESVEELGSSDTTVGFSISGGLAIQLESGFSLRGVASYTGYRSEVDGNGRDGRMINEALDQYISLKILGGFSF